MNSFRRNWDFGCWDEHYLGETSYSDSLDESPEFEEHLQSSKFTAATQKGFSTLSLDKIHYGSWCKPCHIIFARTRLGLYQAFHIEPDSFGTINGNAEQQAAIRELTRHDQRASYIAVQSERGSFGGSEQRDLERLNFDTHRVIEIPNGQRWRSMYDPQIDELWIDDTGEHIVRKYKGFRTASEGWDGVRRYAHLRKAS